MRENYKPIGNYVKQVKLKNKDNSLSVEHLRGIRINKEFMPSVANVIGTDLFKYRVVKQYQFAYNPMHVGRDEILPISMLTDEEAIIVSPAYVIFEVVDTSGLLPEYLMIWCRRSEFDRNAWFTTDSSVRGGFSWDDFCGLELPVPSIDKQKEIVKEYHTIIIMWLTGFDVPFLDTIYIDKPIREHSLIQTISRVNRKYKSKEKGLVVDYIGIKTAMNKALKQFSKMDSQNFEDINASIVVVKDQLDLLAKLFHKFDTDLYFNGTPTEQLECLNKSSEYVQLTKELEARFMYIVKRLKSAYDICCGSEVFTQNEKDHIHFYLAIRTIVIKLTKGDAPDTAQMNAKVSEMITEALKSDGVEEIFKLGSDDDTQIDIFDEDYINKIDKIKLPNTKIKLLQQLLAKALEDFKKVNKAKAVDFSKKFTDLVEKYNERKEEDVLVSGVLEDFTDEIIDLYHALKKEKESFGDMGIDFEEKAFYDILKSIAHKFDFDYPENKLIILAREVKQVVDDKTKYTDWNVRDDIKAGLKVALIMLLAKHGYPPITKDEVFKEIFEQAENFKKYKN